MEEEKKLYPLKFCPLQDNFGWGCATWKLADLGWRDSFVLEGWLASNTMSEVMDTYMDRVSGDDVYESFGRQFPVCIKHLGISGRTPLQVHPDDETGADRYDFLGKAKLWYVLRAGKDARIMLGWKKDTDASELLKGCEDGSVEDNLNSIAPHAGQFLLINPGTVHAAAGDMEILEIAESSPLDFCLCNWGEEVGEDEFDASLDIIGALDFIDYKAWKPASGATVRNGAVEKLVSIPQFEVCRLELPAPMQIYMEKFGSFILYYGLSGTTSVQMDILGQTAVFRIGEGEAMLVPAEMPDYMLVPESRNARLLEITIPARETADPYINPDAAPTLPEDEQI